MKLFFNKKLKAFVRLFLEKITWLNIPARGVKSLKKLNTCQLQTFLFELSYFNILNNGFRSEDE